MKGIIGQTGIGLNETLDKVELVEMVEMGLPCLLVQVVQGLTIVFIKILTKLLKVLILYFDNFQTVLQHYKVI